MSTESDARPAGHPGVCCPLALDLINSEVSQLKKKVDGLGIYWILKNRKTMMLKVIDVTHLEALHHATDFVGNLLSVRVIKVDEQGLHEFFLQKFLDTIAIDTL